MKAKILLCDRFREKLSPEHPAPDENRAAAVTRVLTDPDDLTIITFELANGRPERE